MTLVHSGQEAVIPTEDAAVVLPMLERMARRMAWVGAKCPPTGNENDLWENWANDEMRASMLSVAKAGLEAIRSPSSDIEVAGMAAPVSDRRRSTTNTFDRQQAITADIFTAMIDAILSEATTAAETGSVGTKASAEVNQKDTPA